MKKMNNKGFSLVELIVVIAIMAVLVGVLAPQFIKYVESSRRSTDISNAQNIQSAILADLADLDPATLSGEQNTKVTISATNKPSTIAEVPAVKKSGGGNFEAVWSQKSGTCHVYVGTYDLTSDDATTGAPAYKTSN